jgi:hypothetical protein
MGSSGGHKLGSGDREETARWPTRASIGARIFSKFEFSSLSPRIATRLPIGSFLRLEFGSSSSFSDYISGAGITRCKAAHYRPLHSRPKYQASGSTKIVSGPRLFVEG